MLGHDGQHSRHGHDRNLDVLPGADELQMAKLTQHDFVASVPQPQSVSRTTKVKRRPVEVRIRWRSNRALTASRRPASGSRLTRAKIS
jgi:hypothetical protein